MFFLKQLVLLHAAIIVVCAQEPSLIDIKAPALNQILVPGKSIDIEYIVNAHTSSNDTPNYPLSMDVYLRWKKGQDPNLELKAISGLATQPIASGKLAKTYHRSWKPPTCQFFKRYSPSEWTFAIEFEMKYNEDKAGTTSPSTRTLGPRQNKIVIPLQVNTTLSDIHHKNNGC
ncbi:hypothetical protein BD560DRAFT_421199 [Blakeslea trispora]|nr:hypothetical protein BD560DRAFT_421199 [Blakeslea trispora]